MVTSSSTTVVLNYLKRVIRYINKNPHGVRVSDVVKDCNIKAGNAKEHLSFLLQFGYIIKLKGHKMKENKNRDCTFYIKRTK